MYGSLEVRVYMMKTKSSQFFWKSCASDGNDMPVHFRTCYSVACQHDRRRKHFCQDMNALSPWQCSHFPDLLIPRFTLFGVQY